ncbi:MAG: glutaminyl-peptide cyclotransferase [Verrucomicrobia bacterium]|nr:glutaminyl-peptide cyclotransferase [Verrucomicrobiota bacterium]
MALAAALGLAGCARSATEKSVSVPVLPAAAAAGAVARYTCVVVATWPHDAGAFTQGLVWRNGGLLESTGLNGRSSLREVELKTGRVVKRIDVAREYFAEGLAVIGDRAYQLTWQGGKGFVYDADTFRLEKEFAYDGEGWGLATDGRSLILSDGTSRIRFLDPATFKVTRTIEVTESGKAVAELNELEWINGEIFANVWHTDRIVRIDPASGQVRGVIDCAAIVAQSGRGSEEAVLNGIAYDAAADRLFITGKLWPKIFEVRILAVPKS